MRNGKAEYYNTIDKRLKEPNPNKIYQVAKLYYRYLHDLNYSIERQYRDLYWFDHEHLSNYKGKILHFYCHYLDKERYQFKNGIKPIELFKIYEAINLHVIIYTISLLSKLAFWFRPNLLLQFHTSWLNYF